MAHVEIHLSADQSEKDLEGSLSTYEVYKAFGIVQFR